MKEKDKGHFNKAAENKPGIVFKVSENAESLKLDCDRINKKKVPEKNKTNPIEIQIEETLYSSFLIILS